MVYLNFGKTQKNEVKVIDGGTRESAREAIPKHMRPAFDKKAAQAEKASSYGTEDVLRNKYDNAVKDTPGLRSSIAGKYRKF